MRYRLIVRLTWVLLAAALPSGANAGFGTVAWLDAPGYEAAITALAPGAPANPDSGGVVFTSEDYQKLLLVPNAGSNAFVFDLKQREVASIPRSSVQIGESGGASVRAAAGQTPLGPFLVNKADVRFSNESLRIHLGPKPDLVGEVSLEEILARKPGLRKLAAEYRPDRSAIEDIRSLSKPVEIVVFFGTWCPVCSVRLPLLLKTLEEASNPRISVRFIATDVDHTQPAELLKAYGVHTTPVFVVLQNGAEVGRIDKKPRVTFERDLAEVLKRAG
jgi:thiol-disulfide isomerase/thioredoxin